MSEEITSDVGLTKTIAKKAIEAIGRYLVDNAERIAGEFDCMVEFELNAKFHTKTDEPGAGCPEISIRHQHYIPIAEELQEVISKACVDIPESDALSENDTPNSITFTYEEPKMHCFSCKACDPYGHSVPANHGYCFLNNNIVSFDDVACGDYIPNKEE